MVARETLAEGRFWAAGVPGGDVRVEPHPRRCGAPTTVAVVLSVDRHTGALIVDDEDLRRFLCRTREVVPIGGEVLDVPDTVPVEWLSEETS